MVGLVDSIEEWPTSSGTSPRNPIRKCKGSKIDSTFGLGDLGSMLGLEDLVRIRALYGVLTEFDLELSGTTDG